MDGNDYKPNGKMWLLVFLVSLVFAGALLYFGKNQGIETFTPTVSGTGSRQSRVYTVYYNTGVFSPTNLRVHVGDSVKFQNDSPDNLHVITDSTNNIPDLVGFDSVGDIPPNGTYAFTFTEAGSFGYHNFLNKSERGMVIVRP
jgi:plastocyanin